MHHSLIFESRAENQTFAGNQLHSPQVMSAICSPQTVQQNTVSNAQVSTDLYLSKDVKTHTTLLQTAEAEVQKVGNPFEKCNVRVILDSCSQKSYITTRLRE